MRCPPRLLAPMGLAALLAFVGGCGAPQIDPDAPMPDRFAFTLWMRTTDLRMTYYEMDADGELRFAGGQQAVRRQARAVGRLGAEQRRRLWQIAATTGLLNAPDQPFTKPQHVEYRFEIAAGRLPRHFRVIDDAAPGAKPFHDAVFEMQAQLNEAYQAPGL